MLRPLSMCRQCTGIFTVPAYRIQNSQATQGSWLQSGQKISPRKAVIAFLGLISFLKRHQMIFFFYYIGSLFAPILILLLRL